MHILLRSIGFSFALAFTTTLAACSSAPAEGDAAESNLETTGAPASKAIDGRQACQRVAESLQSGGWPPEAIPQMKAAAASGDPFEEYIQLAIVENRNEFTLAKKTTARLGCSVRAGTQQPGTQLEFTGYACLIDADDKRVLIWRADVPFVGAGGFQGGFRVDGRMRLEGDTFVTTTDSQGKRHFKIAIPDGLTPESKTLRMVSSSAPDNPNRHLFNWEATFDCAEPQRISLPTPN